MTVKTAVGVAVAAACLMSFSAIPGAKSQTAPGYYGSQTHPSNAHPNAPTGSYGSTTGNYVPRAQGNAYPNPAMGTTGSQASPPRYHRGSEQQPARLSARGPVCPAECDRK
jgi:hypothetical protein